MLAWCGSSATLSQLRGDRPLPLAFRICVVSSQLWARFTSTAGRKPADGAPFVGLTSEFIIRVA